MHESGLNENLKDIFFSNEDELLSEINSSKFKKFGKEHFQSNIEKSFLYEQIVKLSIQHQAFNLPTKINEFFISQEISKYFWICSHPLVSELENYLSSPEKKNIKDSLDKDEIRKFYIKWASEKSERERIFFAGTVKNLIDKNDQPDDIIKYLMSATISLHEKKFHSQENFNFLMDYVKDIVLNSNLNEDIKIQFVYYNNIYKAFFNISEKNYDEAKINLLDSLNIFPNGITAQFYLASIAKHCGDINGSINYIKNIILFDLERLVYALDSKNLALFQFILSNAVSYQLFRDKDFADIFPNIKTIFESLNLNSQSKLKSLSILLSKLKELNISDYFDDQINAEISFLNNFIERFSKDRNAFILIIEQSLFDKFNKLIESIKSGFRTVVEVKMRSYLDVFDNKLQVYQNEISTIESDIEKNKERIKAVHKESIEKYERNYNNLISEVENSISSIDTRQDFNPFVAFNNSLIYNLIISLIVFIVGGFIDGMRESQLNELKTSGVILSVLASGLKWSAMIFVLGLVVSVITMISKIIEKSNEKQKLFRKISHLKVLKERETESLRKEMESKIKDFENNTKARVERIGVQIENINKEKNIREIQLKGEIDKTVLEFQNKLNTIFA